MESTIKNKEIKNEAVNNNFMDILKALTYSTIGLIIFFIPIKFNNVTATIIYHIVYKIQLEARDIIEFSIVIYTTIGSIKPFIHYKNKKNNIKKLYVCMRIFSILIILNIFYGKNNVIFLDDTTLSLINEVIINISTLLPISAIFMTFILDYGLIDIVESYFQKTMKNTFKISGKVIINILVYIFTDCFCGFFMTNKLYKQGKLRNNEACIILLNFSILSIPMSMYIVEELDINKVDFFIVSIFILIIANIIQSRIYPLRKKKKSYFIKSSYKETIHKDNKFQKGLDKYLKNVNKENIFIQIINNIEESIKVCMDIIPNLIIILYIGSILVHNGVVVEVIKYIFNPLGVIFKIENYNELSEFCVNLFYNNIIALETLNYNIEYSTRFLIGIICFLTCTSISSNILYVYKTDIKLNMYEFIISYIERIIIIISIYSILHYFYIGYIT